MHGTTECGCGSLAVVVAHARSTHPTCTCAIRTKPNMQQHVRREEVIIHSDMAIMTAWSIVLNAPECSSQHLVGGGGCTKGQAGVGEVHHHIVNHSSCIGAHLQKPDVTPHHTIAAHIHDIPNTALQTQSTHGAPNAEATWFEGHRNGQWTWGAEHGGTRRR